MKDLMLQKFNLLKQKPMLIFGIGCFALLPISFLVIYYLRVIYETPWISQSRHTLILFVISIAFLTFSYFVSKLYRKHSALSLSLVVLFSSVMFSLATPVNQVPDENTHFLRGYAMGQGQFGFDEQHIYPNDVNVLMEVFIPAYNNGHPAKETGTIKDRYDMYYEKINSGYQAKNTGIIIFQVIPYLPQALGCFIARILNLGAMSAYYLARICNAIFFSICCFIALKFADRFKIILFSLMAMPLVSFIVGSNNSDAMLFGLMFIVFGCVLSDNFDNKKFILYATSLAILIMSKASYIVFVPLLFAVDSNNWHVNFKGKYISKTKILIAVIIICLGFYKGMEHYVQLFSNYGEIPRTMEHSNPSEQLAYILAYPIRYICVFFNTLKNNAFFLFSGGLLGFLDVDVKLTSYLTPIILMLTVVKQGHIFRKSDKNLVIAFFMTSLLTYGVVLTGLYLSWTPVTLPQIIGLQMRYLYPAFIGIVLSFGLYISKFYKDEKFDTDISCINTIYIFNIVTVYLMLIIYYLPKKAVVFVA